MNMKLNNKILINGMEGRDKSNHCPFCKFAMQNCLTLSLLSFASDQGKQVINSLRLSSINLSELDPTKRKYLAWLAAKELLSQIKNFQQNYLLESHYFFISTLYNITYFCPFLYFSINFVWNNGMELCILTGSCHEGKIVYNFTSLLCVVL